MPIRTDVNVDVVQMEKLIVLIADIEEFDKRFRYGGDFRDKYENTFLKILNEYG
jgi:hypothetical protein